MSPLPAAALLSVSRCLPATAPAQFQRRLSLRVLGQRRKTLLATTQP